MPLSPMHRRQKKKNFLLLSALVLLAGLLFAITVLKLSG